MKTINVQIEAKSPICHGSFGPAIGNAVKIRRERVVSVEGMPRIPCLSGNSVRGLARRLVMRELFSRAELRVGSLPGKQWDLLYGALANGGHLTGTEKSPSPTELRKLRDALPPLSVFGSALYRFLLQGRARFGIVWPVCTEAVSGGLVNVQDPGGVRPAADLVTETSLVRHVDRDQQDPSLTWVTPMPVMIEAIATGTLLRQEIVISASATDVEFGAIARGLDLIVGLGAKGAAGLGRIALEHDADASPYTAWLDSVAGDDLRARLTSLSELLAC